MRRPSSTADLHRRSSNQRAFNAMDTTTSSAAGAAPADDAARDRLAASLKHIVDEAEQMLRSAQRGGSEQFGAARDKFEAQLRRARAQLAELEDSAIYNARRAARAADHAVHEHPYTAMGIAAGVGVLVGMLIARR
jgi:ElaB/YqjD/DUF883 family membrane-anchored ribosome-binding protein